MYSTLYTYRHTFLLFIFIIFATAAIAQPEKGQWEISGSVGPISMIYALHNFPDGDHSLTEYTAESLNYTVSGKYFLGNRVAIGMSVSYQNIKSQSNYIRSNSAYTANQSNITIAPEVTLVYKRTNLFEFYSLYGLGPDFYKDHLTGGSNSIYDVLSGVNINTYIAPLGFRVGRAFAWHVELGLGYKGLINTGIDYAFGNPIASKKFVSRHR